MRIGRIIFQMLGEQRGRGVRHAHRHAGVAAVGCFDRIHRQGANGIGESALGCHQISMGWPERKDSAGRWFGAYCRERAWRQPWRCSHSACRLVPFCYAFSTMSSRSLEEAMDRAERALLRIERAIERGSMHEGRDDKLRANVANAIAELDSIIKEAGR